MRCEWANTTFSQLISHIQKFCFKKLLTNDQYFPFNVSLFEWVLDIYAHIYRIQHPSGTVYIDFNTETTMCYLTPALPRHLPQAWTKAAAHMVCWQ